MDNVDLTNFLNTLGSVGSTGLGIAGNQQSYDVLNNALKTIGPTQMGNFSMGGPGGLNGNFNLQNGAGSIDLGSFNPSYSGLASVGSGGIGGYNTGLIPGLTSTAGSTLSPALANLTGAYGQNSAFGGAANTQLGSLNDTYNSIFGNTLANMRAQAAPGIQQQAYGLQNTLFGNGTLGSTGAASGSLAAQNFGRGVAQGDASMQLAAQQAAQSGMANQAGIASQLATTGSGLVTNALNNFGNTNQLISGLNTAGLNNGLSALQGAGVLNTMGLNNFNTGMQTQLAAAQARNGSLFPYAVTASSLVQQPNMLNGIGAALGANGGSLLSTLLGNGSTRGLLSQLIPGLTSAIKGLAGGSGGAGSGFTGGSFNSGIGSPIDTTGLQNSNGFSSFDNFANSSGFDPTTGGYTATPNDPYSFLGGDSNNIFGMNSGYDPTTGNFDTGGLNFPSAGGQAADQLPQGSASGYIGKAAGDLNSAFGAYSGLTSGNPIGEASGALNATKLYGSVAGNTAASSAAGAGLGALGIYSGLKQGGAAGDTQAAVGSAQLAGQAANAGYLGSSAGASALGTIGSVAGAVAPLVGLGIYAASTPAVRLGAEYYRRANDGFNQLVSKGINDPQFMANYDQLTNAQSTAADTGENNANALPFSPQQMQQLNALHQQYLAKYMPQSTLWNWSGNNPPAGPIGNSARGGGKASYRTQAA